MTSSEPLRSAPPQDQVALLQADNAEAWAFKRAFFWNAVKALDFNGISGDYVEFGSHGGKTFRLAWDQISSREVPAQAGSALQPSAVAGARRHLWAFDSFRGLPSNATAGDVHPHWQAGAMATDVQKFHEICRAHGIPADRYSVVEGYYEDSLARITADGAPSDIALAYIDCDMHSSTQAVLAFLRPRLKNGMILAFDDYYCWSKDQLSGERRAFLEFVDSSPGWNFERYRDYGWAGSSFVVERLEPEIAAAQQISR
jgi:hypothetical protein